MHRRRGSYAPTLRMHRHRVGYAPTSCWVCTDIVLGMHRHRFGYAPTSFWVCTDIGLGMHRHRVGYAPTSCWVCTDIGLGMHRHRFGYAPTLGWVCTDIDLDQGVARNASWGRRTRGGHARDARRASVVHLAAPPPWRGAVAHTPPSCVEHDLLYDCLNIHRPTACFVNVRRNREKRSQDLDITARCAPRLLVFHQPGHHSSVVFHQPGGFVCFFQGELPGWRTSIKNLARRSPG